MPAPLTLYVDARFRSPYAMSAHVALAEKQLEFEVRLVDLAAGEQRMQPYQSRALTARVPALAHAGFHLTESSAIQEYLEDAFAPPAHPALYPAGAQARARARQVQAWLRTDLAALRRARPIDSVFDAPATTPLDDAAHCDAAKLIRVAEALLPPGQAHLFGAWSLVDTELALMLNRLAHSGDDLPAPLRDYAAAQWQRASVQAWLRHYEAARG